MQSHLHGEQMRQSGAEDRQGPPPTVRFAKEAGEDRGDGVSGHEVSGGLTDAA